jgi:hypothetical protein
MVSFFCIIYYISLYVQVKSLLFSFQSKVQSESKPGEMVNFRAVLLTRCQREFEKDKSSEAGFLVKREEIEKAEDVSYFTEELTPF